MKIAIFIILSILCLMIGGLIATYLIFGILTLAGFIALTENVKPIKWLVIKFSGLIDVLIFVGSIWATATLGVTITASLVIAGLGYSLLYSPWLRKNHKKKSSQINN
jgi:hypothetical protein